eukprot:SAG22_NODE_141_length_17948_cov_129.932665_6_plen_234_part_00
MVSKPLRHVACNVKTARWLHSKSIKGTRDTTEALREQGQRHADHIAALQAERGGGGASPQYDTQIAELQRKMGAENEAHLGRAQHLARHVADNTELLETAQSDIESHQESLRGLGTGLRDLEHMGARRQAAVDRANRELSEQHQEITAEVTASHQELAGEIHALRESQRSGMAQAIRGILQVPSGAGVGASGSAHGTARPAPPRGGGVSNNDSGSILERTRQSNLPKEQGEEF